MRDPLPAASGHRMDRFWVPAFRCHRVVLTTAAVFFALVGALVTPPYVVLFVAPLCGVLVAGLVGLLNPASPGAPSSRSAVGFPAVGAMLLVPAVPGAR